MVGGWHPIYEMEHNPAMFQTTNQHGNEQFEHLRMVISWWSSWSTDSALWKNKNWLVVEPPLWKIWKSVGMILANIWKNNKCSKPPTREWWLSRTFDLELAVFFTCNKNISDRLRPISIRIPPKKYNNWNMPGNMWEITFCLQNIWDKRFQHTKKQWHWLVPIPSILLVYSPTWTGLPHIGLPWIFIYGETYRKPHYFHGNINGFL